MPFFIFDFDGTLADTLQLTVKLFNQIATDFDLIQIGDENLEYLRDHSAQELIKSFKLSPITLLRLVNRIQKDMKVQMPKVQAIQGIPELLQELNDNEIPWGVVTSNAKSNVELFFQRYQITSCQFIHSEKNILGKGRVLKKVLRNYGINSDEAYYIGDEVRDISAGREAGMKVIAVTWGFNSKKVLKKNRPEVLLHRPEGLLDIV